MPRVYDTEKVLALYQRIVEDDARCAELLEELESQVDNRGPGACWPWNGVVTDTGYALFQFKVDGKKHVIRAERMLYMLRTRVVVHPQQVIGRMCVNLECLNPGHFELTDRKGQQRERRFKLIDSQVHLIRMSSRPPEEVAKKYNVSPRTVQAIRDREVYAEVR